MHTAMYLYIPVRQSPLYSPFMGMCIYIYIYLTMYLFCSLHEGYLKSDKIGYWSFGDWFVSLSIMICHWDQFVANNRIPQRRCPTVSSSNHLDGHLGCFYLFTVMDCAVTNTELQVADLTSFGCILGSGKAGQHSKQINPQLMECFSYCLEQWLHQSVPRHGEQ